MPQINEALGRIQADGGADQDDLVGFLNSLPLVVIELKKPVVPARAAFDENLTHWKQQIPALFGFNALPIATGDSLFPQSTSPRYARRTLWSRQLLIPLRLNSATCLVGFLFTRGSTLRVALIAFSFACVVELTQRYHAPWIDSVRETRVGHLVLGTTFNWPDLITYGIGVALGCLLEFFLIRPATVQPTSGDYQSHRAE